MCLVDLGRGEENFNGHLTKGRIYGIFPVKNPLELLNDR
jgi:hypothetical protein